MRDWAPSLVSLALFGLLTPGLVFQLPGKHKPVDFMNMKTSVISIMVHAVIFGMLLMLFQVILHVHVYA
ncbi:uncharacterized protein [Aristolochia californica]|uniref:uncharacterized protein n=1 Tax=Aristolochia californica TaxID=171875 RepID=UPI0035E289BF